MRYFKDRTQAGKLIADKVSHYANKNCAVVCLSEGGVVVGYEIAKKVHASLFILSMESISLPGEPEPVATLSSAGTFTYNNTYSTGELEAINADYHSLVEQERLQAFQKLNRVAKDEGTIPKTLLKGHYVFIVSDGFRNALSLDVAADFFKPVKVGRLIVVSPIASIPAVDRMHLLADEIQCLGVLEDYMATDHYYENNELPSRRQMLDMVEQISLKWDNPSTR